MEREIHELLTAGLAHVGGRLLSYRLTHVDRRNGLTMGASVRVRWADGERCEYVGMCTGSIPDGVLRLTDGDREVGLWRFPFDPALPALPAACDADRMAELVSELGIPAPDLRLKIRAYRPRRRAVVQVHTPQGSVYVKVVRPKVVAELHQRHRALAAAGCPVPHSVGWTDDGLVVLQGLPGRSLRQLLLAGSGTLPDPASVADVLTSLDGLTGPVRQSWADKAPFYADTLAAAMPELAPRVHALAAAVTDPLDPAGPLVPVHGDFYESQLLVADGRITGLLDVDTAGLGDPLDDPACLLGHLSVLAQMRPGRRSVIDSFAARCRREFEQRHDVERLRLRVAAVVLSLATGPYRVQERDWRTATRARVELAECWLASAGALAAA